MKTKQLRSTSFVLLALTEMVVLTACSRGSTKATEVISGPRSGENQKESVALSGTRAVSRTLRVFAVNLSNENVTLTCYLSGTSPNLRNAIARPGIVVFPGGGFTGTSDREAEPVAMSWLAEGYNAFVLRYTVGPPSERNTVVRKALADAEEALEMIRTNATEWNTDPNRIACVGFSAGGYVAVMLGTKGRIKPNALILGYAAILNNDRIDTVVDSNTPPTFIFATRKDSVVSPANSLDFASALEKAGINFELHIFQEGEHGLSLGRPFTSDGLKSMVNQKFAQWLPLSAEWLRILWGDFPLVDEWGEGAMEKFGVLETPISVLTKNPDLWAAILKIAPMLEEVARQPSAVNISLSTLARHVPEQITPELLARIEEAAKGLF
jgi:acetyl esterase/lipase